VILLKQTLRLLPRHTLTLEGGPSLSKGSLLLLELSLHLLAHALLLLELPLSSVASRDTLSIRSAISCLASLAFSTAWLCQDHAPSRVARSYWSWARVCPHRGQVLTRLPQSLVSL
jgi:hypothetical protein